MEQNKQAKESRIKAHFKKHKKKYIIGASLVGVGVGGYYLGKHIGGISNDIKNTNVLVGCKDVVIDNSTDITNVLVRRGHAGNIIRCVETGETFASQSRAASLLGLNKADLSKHLNGNMDSVKGLTFEKVGDFNS